MTPPSDSDVRSAAAAVGGLVTCAQFSEFRVAPRWVGLPARTRNGSPAWQLLRPRLGALSRACAALRLWAVWAGAGVPVTVARPGDINRSSWHVEFLVNAQNSNGNVFYSCFPRCG